MPIKVQLQDAMKSAMKNKAKFSLATIRMIIDRIQKKEKDLLRDLTEEEVISVLQTFKKQLDEEADAFQKVGNQAKVDELLTSINLVQAFLPQMMSEDEIQFSVGLVISGLAKNGHKVDKGSVMKGIMPIVKGKADNKLVNEVVTRMLTYTTNV